jgi:hypothetical protein
LAGKFGGPHFVHEFDHIVHKAALFKIFDALGGCPIDVFPIIFYGGFSVEFNEAGASDQFLPEQSGAACGVVYL